MKSYIVLLLGTMLVSTVSVAADRDDALFTIAASTAFGCRDMGLKMRIDDYANVYADTGDKEPFRKALKPEILSGMCAFFLQGERVFITNGDYFELGLVQVLREEDLEKVLRDEEVTKYWLNHKLLAK